MAANNRQAAIEACDRASSFFTAGDEALRAALEELNLAISIDPTYFRSYFGRARVLDKMGFASPDDGIKDYEKGFSLLKDEPYAAEALSDIYLSYAKAESKRGNKSKAIKLCNAGIEAHANSALFFLRSLFEYSANEFNSSIYSAIAAIKCYSPGAQKLENFSIDTIYQKLAFFYSKLNTSSGSRSPASEAAVAASVLVNSSMISHNPVFYSVNESYITGIGIINSVKVIFDNNALAQAISLVKLNKFPKLCKVAIDTGNTHEYIIEFNLEDAINNVALVSGIKREISNSLLFSEDERLHNLKRIAAKALQKSTYILKCAKDAMHKDSRDIPLFLAAIARSLFGVFRFGQEPEALKEAKDLCKEMIANGETAYLREAMAEAMAVADSLFIAKNWAEAIDLYILLDTIGQDLREASVIRSEQEKWLEIAQKSASRAAYALVQIGDNDKAIVTLERGLATLMRDDLMLRQADLSHLREAADPERLCLVDAFALAASEWNQTANERMTLKMPQEDTPGSRDLLHQQWRALQEAITALRHYGQANGEADLANFLLPPNLNDILSAAEAIPLIYLAYTPHGGLAFVVTNTITVIRLDKFTEAAVTEVMERYLEAYKSFSAARNNALANESPENQALAGKALRTWLAEMDTALAWVGETVMTPVMQAVKKHDLRKEQQRPVPQVAMVGGGLLRRLPLAAAFTTSRWSRFVSYLIYGAGKPPFGKGPKRRYIVDRICLTSTPSAYTLMTAQKARSPRVDDSLLAFRWNGEGHEGFSQECDAACTAFHAAETVNNLKGSLLDTLHKMAPSFLQFSGHGQTDFDAPLNRAGLKIMRSPRAEGLLSMREILRLRLSLRTAVLSACESGLEGQKELAHEGVGLPGALLQAGVAAVIAPYFMVDNRATAHLLSKFYELLRVEKSISNDPAEALRQAQIWLRRNLRRAKSEGSRGEGPVLLPGWYDVPTDHPFYWAFGCHGR